jgi:hypothetical protein
MSTPSIAGRLRAAIGLLVVLAISIRVADLLIAPVLPLLAVLGLLIAIGFVVLRGPHSGGGSLRK